MTSESEPTGKHNQPPDASRKSYEQATQGNPDIAIAPRVPASPPPKSDCQITCKTEKDFWDHVKTGAEIFGIVLLAVYTGYTIKMYCANRVAANAAQRAADIAAKTMQIDQRAWLSPQIVNQIFKKDQPLAVAVQFTNTGKTPAIHVQTCVVAEIVEKTRAGIDISCPESFKSPGFDVIFPSGHISRLPNASGRGGKTNIDPEGLLRELLMEEMREGAKTLYLYGRIDYWDVFKKPHWATFCSWMWLLPPTSGGMPETINWSNCEKGNDVDPEDAQN